MMCNVKPSQAIFYRGDGIPNAIKRMLFRLNIACSQALSPRQTAAGFVHVPYSSNKWHQTEWAPTVRQAGDSTEQTGMAFGQRG